MGRMKEFAIEVEEARSWSEYVFWLYRENGFYDWLEYHSLDQDVYFWNPWFN